MIVIFRAQRAIYTSLTVSCVANLIGFVAFTDDVSNYDDLIKVISIFFFEHNRKRYENGDYDFLRYSFRTSETGVGLVGAARGSASSVRRTRQR